jgi:inorganic triphosphatase YgiF
MAGEIERELKFVVPRASVRLVAAEIARYPALLRRSIIRARYFDTPDRRLARAGIALRIRREGRHWVQTLKTQGDHLLERHEHQVRLGVPELDLLAHQAHPAGERLAQVLKKAGCEGVEPGVRFRTDFSRSQRRIRTSGALVELSFDRGKVSVPAADAEGEVIESPICELEFELVSGSLRAMLALAGRWQKRFGLIVDLRSKAERGDLLAQGLRFPPVRQARSNRGKHAGTMADAYRVAVRECVEQIICNATGLLHGDPDSRREHVHQCRVGIRRLRTVFDAFAEWIPPPPPETLAALRTLFTSLGATRDQDMLDTELGGQLRSAGGPTVNVSSPLPVVDPAEVVGRSATQALFLDLIERQVASAEGQDPAPVCLDPGAAMARRLKRWHRRISSAIDAFDALDDAALHRLRKRIKRQRYAVEFFSGGLQPGRCRGYLGRLRRAQERLGRLNDLLVAREHYRALAPLDPNAWFAVGWFSARASAARKDTHEGLSRLSRAKAPPAARSGPGRGV